MSRYLKHFERELKILEKDMEPFDSDGEPNQLIIHDFIPMIKEIIEVFKDQGHSGASAPFYANSLGHTIMKTLLFKPLSPLTGEEDEWGTEASPDQNNRDGRVFRKKDDDGNWYYTFNNAIVWKEEDGATFTGSIDGYHSQMKIKKFPFTPKTFYVPIRPEGDDHTILDYSQLDAVKEIYE
jgi:hypothetical protein